MTEYQMHTHTSFVPLVRLGLQISYKIHYKTHQSWGFYQMVTGVSKVVASAFSKMADCADQEIPELRRP